MALLVKEQMNHIGTNRTVSEISMILMTALNSESNARLLALEVDDEYVGFTFFNESWGIETGGKYIWLNEIHISKNHRSMGYGTKLLDELKKYCEENHILKILGAVFGDDEGLQQFYFANDFELEEIQLLVHNIKINNKDKGIQNN